MRARTTVLWSSLLFLLAGCSAVGGSPLTLDLPGTLREGPPDPSVASLTNPQDPALQTPELVVDDSGGKTLLPVGVGLTLSPTMLLLGGAADFKVDEKLFAGPALQLGISDDEFLFAPYGQLKYFLTVDEDSSFRPFVQAGVGAVYLDEDGVGSDWGFLINGGAGVRYLTGDDYRIGATALLNFVPGDVNDETFYVTLELIQVVLTF